MKQYLTFLFFTFLIANCSNTSKPDDVEKQQDTTILSETEKEIEENADTVVYFDTTTVKGKAERVIQQLRDSNSYVGNWGTDTLIDINGDKQLDLLIEFYAASGTGLKNGTLIYLYDKSAKIFWNEPISLPNPTFNFNNYTIVSYYVGNGGGFATELKWRGYRLDTLESIDIDITTTDNKLKVESIIRNYKTGKEFRTVTNEVKLPKKYNYYNYNPIVRKEE